MPLSQQESLQITSSLSPTPIINPTLRAHSVVSESLGPLDCSPPGSSVYGIPRQERWSGLPFSLPGEIFPTQGSNPGLQGPLHWQVDSLPLSHLENPIIPIVQTKSEAETNQSSGPEFGP